MLRFLTAGETHGKCLTLIVEGMPSNVPVSISEINEELAERQKGAGRGGRMKIETDRAEVLSGIRNGLTLGSPIAIQIANRDWVNWEKTMSPDLVEVPKSVFSPRPGHADLAGALKYNQKDMRNILERASARETAARVAAGALAMQLLRHFGISFFCHVVGIGGVRTNRPYDGTREFENYVYASPVRCGDPDAEEKMLAAIEKAAADGDSLGGIVEVIINGLPPGLGSHVQWDRKLDGRLAQSIMSIQAIKGVEVGAGFAAADLPGSGVHDEIFYENGFYRKTNRAGGIEGGITNGAPVVIRAAMKPIPTLYKPLASVDIRDKSRTYASVERSDTCAVPAAAIVCKAAAAWVIADAFLEKFGGDSFEEIKAAYKRYEDYLQGF